VVRVPSDPKNYQQCASPWRRYVVRQPWSAAHAEETLATKALMRRRSTGMTRVGAWVA